MTKSDNIESESTAPKGGRPGPTDEGKNGGMATREVAPEVAEDKGQDS
ncbi:MULTISPECIES: hypothetical protein [unclassified Rhodococcus (in: high G+C Gram-positive bacteria)]|nr:MULTISPECIES: hypothetical protein [unclassified Rhodococcus (in: high G+C Gram-positive bacteria)]